MVISGPLSFRGEISKGTSGTGAGGLGPTDGKGLDAVNVEQKSLDTASRINGGFDTRLLQVHVDEANVIRLNIAVYETMTMQELQAPQTVTECNLKLGMAMLNQN